MKYLKNFNESQRKMSPAKGNEYINDITFAEKMSNIELWDSISDCLQEMFDEYGIPYSRSKTDGMSWEIQIIDKYDSPHVTQTTWEDNIIIKNLTWELANRIVESIKKIRKTIEDRINHKITFEIRKYGDLNCVKILLLKKTH